MSAPTYTNRHAEVVTVESMDESGGVKWTNGWNFYIPEEHRHLFVPGAVFLQETQQFSLVRGMGVWDTEAETVSRWLWRKSDEDIEAERTAWLADLQVKREAELEENREDWTRREAALPGPLRRRLQRFRDNGGVRFDTEGWGYELIVSELAAIYAANGGNDDDDIDKYAKLEGTTGNQHGMGRALASALTSGELAAEDTVANAPSALAPLTGDLDYSGGS